MLRTTSSDLKERRGDLLIGPLLLYIIKSNMAAARVTFQGRKRERAAASADLHFVFTRSGIGQHYNGFVFSFLFIVLVALLLLLPDRVHHLGDPVASSGMEVSSKKRERETDGRTDGKRGK